MSDKLKEIRKKIDSIDNKVHDLLMDRALLVSDVAAEKKKNNLQIVHPAREAMMIRRLLARHKGPLPEAAVVSIWRELVGAVSMLQTGLSVVVAGAEDNPALWDMARDYFGSVLPMKKISSALSAVGAVREGEVSFAVLPWPEDSDENPWWTYLLSQDGEKMRIVCRFPYGACESESDAPQNKGLVVSRVDFKPSGDDYSFIALVLDASVSRGRIFDALKKMDLEPLSMHTKSGVKSGGESFHLLEVHSYLEEDDQRLKELQGKFDGACRSCLSLGGYPAPPVFKKIKSLDVGRKVHKRKSA